VTIEATPDGMGSSRRGRLLLVLPPVVQAVSGRIEVDAHFAENLRLYLENFELVTFACPVCPPSADEPDLRGRPLEELHGADRLRFIPLPCAFREDRYARDYVRTRALLSREIEAADSLLLSPTAMFDWATLATKLARAKGRRYDIECDIDLRSLTRFQLDQMPRGPKRIRKTLWMQSLNRQVARGLRDSSVALLQGREVFEAYKDIAPNPHEVLNIQVDASDRPTTSQLDAKRERIESGGPLRVRYAGRMIERKGPEDWLRAIRRALDAGVSLDAIWFGDGPLLQSMRNLATELGLDEHVQLPGLTPRNMVMDGLREADLFVFCHKVNESPRNLTEALACGCGLVGYGSLFPRSLVEVRGGGEFTAVGDWRALGDRLVELDGDRSKLADVVGRAASSGADLDRDSYMQARIDLIKRFATR
jgi:glycosyltransferase involved in cell wall biosynthesis